MYVCVGNVAAHKPVGVIRAASVRDAALQPRVRNRIVVNLLECVLVSRLNFVE